MSSPPAAEDEPTVVEFPIRRNIVITCCFLVMLLGMTAILLHEVERLDAVEQDVPPRCARDTFFTMGLAVDVLSAVFVFFWTWIFSPFRSKRLYQLLPLFLIPGSLCLVAILALEVHGVSRPETLGMIDLVDNDDADDDGVADSTADSMETDESATESTSVVVVDYSRGPFAIAALVACGLVLVANIVIIISVFVYTFDCRYCAFYDHSTYRYGNMKFQVRRISTARAAVSATTVV